MAASTPLARLLRHAGSQSAAARLLQQAGLGHGDNWLSETIHGRPTHHDRHFTRAQVAERRRTLNAFIRANPELLTTRPPAPGEVHRSAPRRTVAERVTTIAARPGFSHDRLSVGQFGNAGEPPIAGARPVTKRAIAHLLADAALKWPGEQTTPNGGPRQLNLAIYGQLARVPGAGAGAGGNGSDNETGYPGVLLLSLDDEFDEDEFDEDDDTGEPGPPPRGGPGGEDDRPFPNCAILTSPLVGGIRAYQDAFNNAARQEQARADAVGRLTPGPGGARGIAAERRRIRDSFSAWFATEAMGGTGLVWARVYGLVMWERRGSL
jgi:hypothetical protein